jgi:hypothetical protein
VIRWWTAVVAGAATALLAAWAAHVAGVPLTDLLSIGAVAAALIWMVVLVTLPWNLYFGAKRVLAEIAASRRRGIEIPAAHDAEAGRIARRMLWFAVGGHIGSAAATAAIAYLSDRAAGYYITGFYLLSTVIRPAAAYFAHLRRRIATLTMDSTHPREDVASLKDQADIAADAVKELRTALADARHSATEDIRRTESVLAGDIAHTRQLLTADLGLLQDAQAADRLAARSRDDDLERKIDQMVRRVEATLDGISDHQELLTGLRALVRMIRADPA